MLSGSTEREYVQRWEAFLEKITARMEQILGEAEQGFRGLIAQGVDDPVPFGNAMQAIGQRILNLQGKIDDVWSEQIFEHVDSSAAMERCERVMEDSKQALTDRWESFRTHWMAEAMRSIWPRVQAAMAEPVHCSQCGAELERHVLHRADTVVCASCGSVNNILPPRVVASYYATAPHVFAEEQALPLRRAIERFRLEVDRRRHASGWNSEPLETLERWLEMERAYWTRYAEVKQQVEGSSDEDRERFVQSRVDSFRRTTLESESAWVRAHGRAS